MCSRTCERTLVDKFDVADFTCPYGMRFSDAPWKLWDCRNVDGECRRPCIERFRHFKAEVPPKYYNLIKDYNLFREDNALSFHYATCGEPTVSPMKIVGVKF